MEKLRWSTTVCPVCGSDQHKLLFHDINRRERLPLSSSYVSCRICGMVYLNPAPDWQQFKEYYDWLFAEDHPTDFISMPSLGDRPGLVGKALYAVRRFRFRPHSWPQEIGDNRKLLDVGCGSAAKLVEFVAPGWQVFGVDVSASALAVARRTVSEGVFLEGELEDVDLPLDSFDVIRLDNVLEHVPEPRRLLRRCRELLNSQGCLYICVPHGRSLSMRLLGKYSINSWIPFHLSLFTAPTLRRILSDVGFARVEIYYYSPMHSLPASLKQRMGIRKSARLPSWVEWGLKLVLLPIGSIAAKLGWGEELVAVAQQ